MGGTRESFLGLLGRCDFSPFTQWKANVFPSPWFTWSISICVAPGFSHKTLDTSLSFMPGLEYEIRSECDFHLEGNWEIWNSRQLVNPVKTKVNNSSL